MHVGALTYAVDCTFMYECGQLAAHADDCLSAGAAGCGLGYGRKDRWGVRAGGGPHQDGLCARRRVIGLYAVQAVTRLDVTCARRGEHVVDPRGVLPPRAKLREEWIIGALHLGQDQIGIFDGRRLCYPICCAHHQHDRGVTVDVRHGCVVVCVANGPVRCVYSRMVYGDRRTSGGTSVSVDNVIDRFCAGPRPTTGARGSDARRVPCRVV